jgi:hypothetical protein
MSCGVALHYLRTALTAGKQIDVARLPERDDPDLLGPRPGDRGEWLVVETLHGRAFQE